MLAVLAHHLRAALVPLDVDFTFWTTFDWRVVFFVLVKRAGKKREFSYADFVISIQRAFRDILKVEAVILFHS